MGNGVMTTKEFGMESTRNKSNSEDKKDKSVSKTERVEVKDIYELESADGKTGNCAFYDSKGKEQKLKLTDGCFTIPKTWNPVKRQQYKKMLLEAGFVLQPTKTIEAPKAVEIITYNLMHPDHSDNDPINGDFKVKVSGKQVKLNVVNGIIETMDLKVKTQLKRKGFMEYTGAMGSEDSEKDEEIPEIPLEEGYDASKDPALAHDDDDADLKKAIDPTKNDDTDSDVEKSEE